MRMRVNRRFLYFGVFLVAIGGALVAADLADPESAAIVEALRLWPLAFVAIGVGVVLRRTRFSLPGGMLAAAVPGLVLGGGFAFASRIAWDCETDGERSTDAIHEGVFDGPAQISVASGCGSLVVSTAPGAAWRLDGTDTAGRATSIDASGQSLSIDAGGADVWHRRGADRDNWHLTLPTSDIDDLSFDVNAGAGQIGLPGARIGHLDVSTNAARTTVDLSEASVASLSGSVNAGLLSIHLPAASDVVATLEVNAGELDVCVPSDVGLRVHQDGSLSGLSIDGRHQGATDFQSPNYASATHHADVDIDINLGNVKINPIGGCK
jgi:hypothetical protein